MEPASAFVKQQVLSRIDPAASTRSPERDPKSRLLHFAQMLQFGQPNYQVVDTSGPDHERVFEVAVIVNGQQAARGTGRTKQIAEKAAAETALRRLQVEAEASEPRSDSDGADGATEQVEPGEPNAFGAGTGGPSPRPPRDRAPRE